MASLPQQTLRLIQQVIIAERLHISRQSLALSALLPDSGNVTYEAANSTTVRLPEEPDGKLNHTVGFGMSGPVTQADLLAIEQTPPEGYPQIWMCEHADPSAYEVLKREGYEYIRSISHFATELGQDILEFDSEPAGDFAITTVTAAELSEWVDSCVDGFRDGDRRPSLLKLLAQSAANRADTTLFFAKIDSKVAGSAALAVIEVGDTKLGHVYIDSTLPAFRGRGVHQALLKARLQAAKKAGCQYVFASAKEGSGSSRNMQKAGIPLVFTSRVYGKKIA